MAETGSKVNWYENIVLDFGLGAQAYTPPTGIFIKLCSAGTTIDDTITTARGVVGLTYSADNDLDNWTTAAAGSKNNAVDFQFPTATANWGTAQYWTVCESAVAGGRALYWGEMATAKFIGSGDVFRFASGAITITES